MGKVKYRESSKKFDKIVVQASGGDKKENLSRGHGTLEVLQISVDSILPFQNQARKKFDEKGIRALADSIEEVGITTPILVMKTPAHGKFQVINGERRLRAAKLIKLEKVPCIVTEDQDRSELIAIIDNIQRADLHPIELAGAYSSLVKNHGDKKTISQKIGVGYSAFVETLKLNELPEEIKNYLLNNDIRSRAIFRKILKIESLDMMKECLGIIKKEKNGGIIIKNILEVGVKDGKIEFNIKKNPLGVVNKKELVDILKEIISIIETTCP